jgi:phage terminase large subunit
METIKFSELTHFSDKQNEAKLALESFKYILYGGAMGGGKSYWLRWIIAYWLMFLTKKYELNGIVGAIFCEDYPSLKDRQTSKIAREFPEWLGEMHADHKEYGRCFLARPEYGGWVIALRNLDDASKYKSAEFAIIGIDELTKNKKEIFDDLKTRLRWPGVASFDCKFVAGTNPGEIGHAWAKKWWLDRDFEEEMQEEGKLFKYIPAKASDNSYLDVDYIKVLDSLPADKRKAYREGDWNIFKGQYFSEWREEIHVVDPFEIPMYWRRFIMGDYGYSNPASVHWGAVDEDGVLYLYRELYVTEHTYENLAAKIVSLTPFQELQQISYWVFDPAIWSKKDEPLSGAEKMQNKYKEITGRGLNLIQANNERVIGWGQVREYLKPFTRNDQLLAKLQVFKTCKDFIRTFPSLVYDKYKVEDLDSDGEDHAADDVRYGIMSRPQSAPKVLNGIARLLNKPEKVEQTRYE